MQFSGGGLVLSQILLIVIILFIPIYREPFFIFYLFYTIGINEEFERWTNTGSHFIIVPLYSPKVLLFFDTVDSDSGEVRFPMV